MDVFRNSIWISSKTVPLNKLFRKTTRTKTDTHILSSNETFKMEVWMDLVIMERLEINCDRLQHKTSDTVLERVQKTLKYGCITNRREDEQMQQN